MKLVLFQPEIPQNTGNIARSCAATNSSLLLVHPLGFSLQSRHMKRAGLDYWKDVTLEETDNLETYLDQTPHPFFFFSSKGKKLYTQAPYTEDSLLVFGSETSGLPEIFWKKWGEKFYTIPMTAGQRCLNLASSAAVVLYEGLRQTNFCTLLSPQSAVFSEKEKEQVK